MKTAGIASECSGNDLLLSRNAEPEWCKVLAELAILDRELPSSIFDAELIVSHALDAESVFIGCCHRVEQNATSAREPNKPVGTHSLERISITLLRDLKLSISTHRHVRGPYCCRLHLEAANGDIQHKNKRQ